ncbi:hypothetical protein [Shewanella sp. T24-MNA-CIBAN-0130]|uniref:hypothetical protein n=1 Tax=Shewanella sp. T24-MNA-CIBAN-0130 TaxID=3140470 RepID=UPI0033281B7C
MHIIAMLALLIAGYAAGEKLSWLIGLPIICLGLYMFVVGGKSMASWRQTQEGLFALLGLFCMAGLFVSAVMGW